MQLTVTGKQVAIGEALRQHIGDSLDAILGKYFGEAQEAHVVIAREAYQVRAETSIRIGRGIVVNGSATADDFYAAFDACAERIGKQLRRYKRRLRDHHAKARPVESSAEQAKSYILAPAEDEADDANLGDGAAAPVIVAEISTELPLLSVGEAVMRIDLADLPVLLFRSRGDGELNLVYRRNDGNIGWIEPAPRPHGRS